MKVNNFKKNKKEGISLITLIITIIIIIILSAIIILTLSNNNLIGEAKKARFIDNVANYKDELNLWLTTEYSKKLGELDLTQINATKDFGTYNDLKIKEIIKSMTNKDQEIFEIQEGKLVYVGNDETEKSWIGDVDVEEANALVPPYTDEEITEMIQAQGYIPIASATELNNLRYSAENTFGAGTIWEGTYTAGIDKKYIQVKNVDLSIYANGNNWVPIGGITEAPFYGIYDGNSNVIKKLYINNSNLTCAGIFGYVSGVNENSNVTSFKNIRINDFYITGDSISDGAALIAFGMGSEILIDNVRVNGKLENVKNGAGIISTSNSTVTKISNCIANVDIKVIYEAGGITKYISNSNSYIKGCKVKGDIISTENYVGGIVANNNDSNKGAEIEYCYFERNC